MLAAFMDSALIVETMLPTDVAGSPSGGYYLYDYLDFPLRQPKHVEFMECYINGNQSARKLYVQYLKASRTVNGDSLERVLRRMFADEALLGYKYNSTAGSRRSTRPNLYQYNILNRYMLEAWPDITPESLYEQLSELVPKMSRRAYNRLAHQRRKTALDNLITDMIAKSTPTTKSTVTPAE
nr:uncharacterized protein LOC109413330 isoform X2 [Aedes albopictus]